MSKQTEALKLALEALEGVATWVEMRPKTHPWDTWKRVEPAITAIREALAQPEQEPNKNGSPCPEFWDWLPKAYNFEGDGNFTKYNMEVAFLAGKQASQSEQEPNGYVQKVIDALYENSDPVSVEAAELLEHMAQPEQEPRAWINWCAATGKRSVSFECESELASEPLYAGITQNTQYHYSKFHSWFDSELHRQKYTKDHPAYLAAQEAWNAANDAAQHRINRLNAEIEAWKVRFKIAEDALAKLNGPEQKPVQQQEPVVWMYVNKSTHETKFQKHMRDFVDHSLWSEVPLYGEPLANHELQCVCGAVWLGDEMVHLPNKHQPASKPLTDEEIMEMYNEPRSDAEMIEFARAIEAAHGIKENT